MKLAGLLALGLALVGAALAGAYAAAPLESHLSSTILDRHDHQTTVARCSAGTEVVSGGFATPDVAYAGGGPYTDVTGAWRKRDHGFAVQAKNDAFAKGHVYAFAYCADLAALTVASRRTEVGARNNGTVTARCPDGLTAISGGWSGAAARGGRPEMIPFLSKRAGTDGWKAAARNSAFKGSADLIAHAYCAATDAPPEARVHQIRMPGFNLSSAGSSCAAGSQAIAGGFDVATPHGFAVGAQITTSRRKKGGVRWKVTVINGDDPRHLRVFAYCAPLTP